MPDQPICGLCRRGRDVEDVCGPLHYVKDCSAHHKCMQYSACLVQYKFDSFGGFKIRKVLEEITRGKHLKCTRCKSGANGKSWTKKGGATSGCAIKKCPKSFHFYCAKTSPNVITKRIEITKSDNEKVVLYRVFCSEEHKQMFEQGEIKNTLRYMNDSEDSSDSNDDDDDDDSESEDSDEKHQSLRVKESQDSNASQNVNVTQLSNSPKGYQFSTPRTSAGKKKIKKGMKEANSSIDKLFQDVSSSDSESTEETSSSNSNSKDSKPEEIEEAGKTDILVPSWNNDDLSSNVQKEIGTVTMRRTSTPIALGEISKVSQKSKKRSGDVEGQSGKGVKKKCLDNVELKSSDKHKSSLKKKTDDSESEGYGSSPDTKDKMVNPTSTKSINSKLPKYFKLVVEPQSPDSCVLCFLESDCGDIKACNDIISPVVTNLYNVNGESVYLWRYDNVDMTSGHMVYLWKDISKAVRDKDLTLLTNLLTNFDDSNYEQYQASVQLNKEYDPECEAELYSQLRQSICDNLRRAVLHWNYYVGSIHYFKSLSCHIMFLCVTDLIDPNHVIRASSGHQLKPFVWTKDDSPDIELVSLQSNPSNHCKRLKYFEYEVLMKWFNQNVKHFTLLTRPKESYLLCTNTKSVTFLIKQKLKEKATDSHTSEDVIMIGPVNHSILNMWNYLEQCVPALIEERLTALRDIYIVYDLDKVGAVSVGHLIPPLPGHVDVKMVCGHNPSKFPLSCVILQLSLNQDQLSESGSSDSSLINSKTKKKMASKKAKKKKH